jgi:hypothetical protein
MAEPASKGARGQEDGRRRGPFGVVSLSWRDGRESRRGGWSSRRGRGLGQNRGELERLTHGQGRRGLMVGGLAVLGVWAQPGKEKNIDFRL